MTFADYIKETIGKQPVEGIVIGAYGRDGYGEPAPKIPQEKRGVVLSKEEALSLLTQDYYGGYGSPDCYAVYIWTKDKVYSVTQYDGSTSLNAIPRNPTDVLPDMFGR